jgi:uncharacterized protein (TIGR00156 family)
MNRKFYGGLFFVLAFAGTALNAQEGYRGPGPDVLTVESAKGLRDDSPVTVRGRIEKFLGDEKYLFVDDTGSIIIDIDDKLWYGISADQNDGVEITGEIDREFTRVEIDASSMKKL